MKKILRRTFVSLLVVVVVCVGVGVYWFTHDSERPTNSDTYLTDAYGSTYLAVVDGDGHTYAVVTDADGNRYAAEFNGSEVGSTVGQINDDISLEEVPTNFTGEHMDVTVSNKYDGDVATTLPTLPDNSEDKTTTKKDGKNEDTTTTKNPDKKPQKLEAYRIEKYQKVFASGTYLMEITTNDPDLGDMPVTMAIKNGNMYVKMTMELDETRNMNCSMLYLRSKDTMYLLFDDWKKYSKMPESMMGEDMDMSAMLNEMNESDIGEISVSEVEIDGKKLILESYNSTIDGTTVNYYFDGETLVRRDDISPSGVVDSTYFTRITTDVPDSCFEIPQGYGYLNLGILDVMM